MTCRRRYFSASACGSSRVLMIGRDRGRRRRHALPDVLGALATGRTSRAFGRLQHLARAADQLAGDQERQQHVGDPGELAGPHDQVVLVAAVRVARRVGVVLEQIDVAADALVGQPLLGVDQQVLEHPLAGAVVGDQLREVVALGGGVLGVAAHVEIVAARRCAGTRSSCGPTTPPAGTGSGQPRPGLSRRWPWNVQVTPNSVSMPMIRRCTLIETYWLRPDHGAQAAPKACRLTVAVAASVRGRALIAVAGRRALPAADRSASSAHLLGADQRDPHRQRGLHLRR